MNEETASTDREDIAVNSISHQIKLLRCRIRFGLKPLMIYA